MFRLIALCMIGLTILFVGALFLADLASASLVMSHGGPLIHHGGHDVSCLGWFRKRHLCGPGW